MTEPNVYAGGDIGKTNLAIAFVMPDSSVCPFKFDLGVVDGDRVKLANADYGRVIHNVCERLRPFFERTRRMGIENQPPRVGNMVNVAMHVIQAHLESTIRHMYPHIDLVVTDPKAVRAWLGTAKGEYDERKLKSLESDVFSKADIDILKKIFRERKIVKKVVKYVAKADDVVEAAIIALYVRENTDVTYPPMRVEAGECKDPAVYTLPPNSAPIRARVPERVYRLAAQRRAEQDEKEARAAAKLAKKRVDKKDKPIDASLPPVPRKPTKKRAGAETIEKEHVEDEHCKRVRASDAWLVE